MPKRSRKVQVQKSQVQIQIGEHFEGPLPPPDALRSYNEIVPGAADRIIGMAEKQMVHRQQMERRVIFWNTARSFIGQFFAFVLAGGIAAGAIYILAQGQPIEGLGALLVDLAALVYVFIKGRQQQHAELGEKKYQRQR